MLNAVFVAFLGEIFLPARPARAPDGSLHAGAHQSAPVTFERGEIWAGGHVSPNFPLRHPQQHYINVENRSYGLHSHALLEADKSSWTLEALLLAA